MNAINIGSTVTRDGMVKEITETVPPFTFIVIGQSGNQAASRERDHATVWEVGKPGRSAPLSRPEAIAVNGPMPIAYKGYGTITQDWPARVAILSEELPDVHGSVGIGDDNWLAVAGGGLFTVLGADPVFLRENGATQDGNGQWINLPEKVLLWITPRGESRPWGQGWGLTNDLPTIESLDFLLEQPLQSRLHQPYQGDSPEATRLFEPADHVTLWEPVLVADDHLPNEDEEGLPVKRSVEWLKVREAGTYLLQFGGMIAKTNFGLIDNPDYIGIGLFGAAWNAETEEFEIYDQPAAVASRWPFSTSIEINGVIGGEYEYGIDTLLIRSQENVTASAIVELKAGWAIGFLKVGETACQVEHFHWSAHKLGSASNPGQFWLANAGKIDWAGDDHSPVS